MTLHSKYGSNLEEAKCFEDFVSDVLYGAGLPIHIYRSRHYQVSRGESRSGLEVKLDRSFRNTGNLYIETSERWNGVVSLRPAGIYGKNWLYAIGDFYHFWIFATKVLQNLEKDCVKAVT